MWVLLPPVVILSRSKVLSALRRLVERNDGQETGSSSKVLQDCFRTLKPRKLKKFNLSKECNADDLSIYVPV